MTRAFDRFEFEDQTLDVEWHLPAAEPVAWLLLQHGFSRRCAHLRGTAAALVQATGVATLCVNADMAGGAPALARDVAAWLASAAARAPDGRGPPARLVVGGHSAGGLFAARVGAALVERPEAAGRLAGALLFDPVGGRALGDALSAVSHAGRRPVWALLAPAGRCNALHLALPALQRVRAEALAAGATGEVGAVLRDGTHADAEGEDSDTVARLACGEGAPRPEVVARLRRLAAQALRAVVDGQPPVWPGAQDVADTDGLTPIR